MNRPKITSLLTLVTLVNLLISSCGENAASVSASPTPELPPEVNNAVVTETPAATSTPTATPTPVDTGWQGEYFNNDQFQGPAAFTQTDTELNFNWADGSPDAAIPADHFTARWTRCLDLEERAYTFSALGDDLVRVTVDDLLVVQTNFPAEQSYIVSAGRHCIKVEYRDDSGPAVVQVGFTAGDPFPASDASAPWQAEYYSNPNLTEPAAYTRNDPEPVFDWKNSNPVPGTPVDGFSVRWTRCLDLESRDYTFTVIADDYARVLLDNVPVLESSPAANAEKTVPIVAGSHCIKVEYREEGGVAFVNFSFK
jgi:hypothetical protein